MQSQTIFPIDVDKLLDALMTLILEGPEWTPCGDVGREFREKGFKRILF
jgi:hypothetical protein